MISAALVSKSGSLLARYRSNRCGCSRACARMRAVVLRLLLHPPAHPACTRGVAVRGLLPSCLASSPSIPDSLNCCFQRAIVRAVVSSSRLIALYVLPFASARIRRARNTSPAGSVRDCDHRVNFSRCSAVSEKQLSMACHIPGTLFDRQTYPNRWDRSLERVVRERRALRAM